MPSIALGLYLRTARHFRLSQIVARLRKELDARLLRGFGWLARSRYTVPENLVRRPGAEFFHNEDSRYHPQLDQLTQSAHRLQQGTFRLLNRELPLGRPVNWNPASTTRLWRYNLHYFDYALDLALVSKWNGNESAAKTLGNLFHEWIEHNPTASGVGWHSYPIARRIVNWIQAVSLVSPRVIFGGDDRVSEWLASLYVQAKYLEDHLEYDCLGNHLLADAKALFFAGLFFQGQAAERWLSRGEHILWEGLDQQILPDGCHFERAPMYQAIVFQDYLEVVLACRLNHRDIPAWVLERLRSMGDFLDGIRHPDGEIPLIGDSAFGIARSPRDILATAEILLEEHGRWPDAKPDLYSSFMAPQAFCAGAPIPSAKKECGAWPATGYFALQGARPGDRLIVDSKPMGPPHIPAHGHCSLFSYELSINGTRVVVDSGVEEYEPGPWRSFWRSTRAHNTVTVDGCEQSEIWAAFRVGHRTRVLATGFAVRDTASMFTAVHDGFVRQHADIRHRRFIAALDPQLWLVLDEISGLGRHKIESFIHFHPNVSCELNGSDAIIRFPTGSARIYPHPRDDGSSVELSCVCGQVDPIQGWYAQKFGARQPNPVLTLTSDSVLPGRVGYLIAPEGREVTWWDLSYTEHEDGLRADVIVMSRQGNMTRHFEISNRLLQPVRFH
jgi:uncharacterized heparinase superfamily protein